MKKRAHKRTSPGPEKDLKGTRKAIPTVLLKLHVNHVLAGHIDLAVGTGLFGTNRPNCAERLIAEGLRRLVKEGVITTTEDHEDKN